MLYFWQYPLLVIFYGFGIYFFSFKEIYVQPRFRIRLRDEAKLFNKSVPIGIGTRTIFKEGIMNYFNFKIGEGAWF